MRSDENSGHEWVRFATGAASAERLTALEGFVAAAAAEKARAPGRQAEVDEAQWESRLPLEARVNLGAQPGDSPWRPQLRPLAPGWDAASLIEVVMQSEYELCEVTRVSDSEAELRFKALAWPYGGISALLALVEAFGFDVLAFFEGSFPPMTREEFLAEQGD